ncbi:transcriptional regulator, TetR family [Nocardia farcinica]|uniref:Fatty acid metabolism regulator protein n=1 Tax=Nocardia farcinica TaxID=37329 RepID=A0A0H5P3Q3_NOCFR|nr:TetR/AcrR family transcriptional regulator [Nocardia farcinica]AXK87700.1 TetR/AcrR family transcriptional regulator [Nocardia farcinica]MBA4856705.1 TetR/AcrR family transcriptional regulator [Nocardia farcinica]MBC9818849.1 TetR/AcrR family transcriptional regulator [Nocardia farcinica]MBF6141590.1 TetR/AcrR family transcriptional regulator [Nocardia farcinica]CRY82297.1 Fatty acid metabolism regulator protein [Nocardia farcinica]
MPYRRTPAVQARLDAQAGQIVQAATRVLSEAGFAGLSMAAVAANAGVATGTVYKHFAGKAELVTAVFRAVVAREVDAVAAAAAEGGAVERVVAAVETFACRALKNPKLAYVLLAEPVDAVVDAERLRFRRAFADAFAAAVSDGVAAGELPGQDARTTAAALVGAIGEVLVGPLADAPHSESVVPQLVTFARRALGVPERARAAMTAPETGVSDADS